MVCIPTVSTPVDTHEPPPIPAPPELAASSERDVASLRAAGYEVIPDESCGTWESPTSFRRADSEMTLDWAHGTAHPVTGCRLEWGHLVTTTGMSDLSKAQSYR